MALKIERLVSMDASSSAGLCGTSLAERRFSTAGVLLFETGSDEARPVVLSRIDAIQRTLRSQNEPTKRRNGLTISTRYRRFALTLASWGQAAPPLIGSMRLREDLGRDQRGAPRVPLG